MGKSKSKKSQNNETDSEVDDTDTQTNTENTDTETMKKDKRNKKNKKNKGFIDKFIKLNSKTKTYLSIICMLLIFAGFIWYRQKNKEGGDTNQIMNQTVNQTGGLEKNLENLKQTVSEIIESHHE